MTDLNPHIYHCGPSERFDLSDADFEDPSRFRKDIEPWLTAVFQSEHLSLLLGSGFTCGVALAGGGKPADMSKCTWECDFGESITLSTAPATDWDPGDTITGQSSGATAVVVSKTSSLTYKIKQHLGTFTLGEIVGVTGVPTKLAVQDGTSPTFSGTPSSAGCFGGAGNSPASLNNYASIPSQWE